jgi:phosphoesterase RecJ-like protein
MITKKIIKAIERSQRILITAHVNPDLDSLCSQLALYHYLKPFGKKVSIINETGVPARYHFIKGLQRVRPVPQRCKGIFDLAFVLDCGDLHRIGKVRDLLTQETRIINIDHHVSNTGFGDLVCVDPKSSSTGEVIYEVFTKAGCPLSRALAKYLYIAIMTDTGNFRYASTSARTHQVVSDLMRFNLRPDKLYEQIYESIPFEDFFQFTKVIGRLKVSYDHKVISYEFNQTLQKKFSSNFDLKETTLNFLKLVKGVELVVIFSALETRRTRVNFRSTREVNVSTLAARFGGGGHKRASGCTVPYGIRRAQTVVFREIDKIFSS